MSKIQELLNHGSMIDVNLMSDHLKTILSELCTLVIKQGDEIQTLQTELHSLTSEKQLKEQLEKIQTQINQINNESQQNSNQVNELNNQMTSLITKIESNVADQLMTAKYDIENNIQSKMKDIEGQNFIITEQIKNIWQKVDKSIESDVNIIKKDLENIHSTIDLNPLESPKEILKQIDELKNSIKELNQKSIKNVNNREKENQILQKSITSLESNITSKIKNVEQEISEVKKSVIDQPSFEIDGKISAESLMNAILRNSRRIDGFNEIIMNVKNQNDQAVSTVANFSNVIDQMREDLVEFVKEHNNTKRTIVDQIDQCYINTENLRKEFPQIHRTLESMITSQHHSFNTIVSTFSNIYSYLGSISSKIPPKFEAFDDDILEHQSLYDSIMADKEMRKSVPKVLESVLIKKENIKKQIGQFSNKIDLEELKSDFELPYDQIPISNAQTGNNATVMSKRKPQNEVVVQRRINQSATNSNNNNSDKKINTQTQQTKNENLAKRTDNEFKQNIDELTKISNRHEADIINIKKFIDEYTKKPFNNENNDKSIQINDSKNQVMYNTIMKNFDKFVQKSELEFLVSNILSRYNFKVVNNVKIPELIITNANLDPEPVNMVTTGKQSTPDNSFKTPSKIPLPKLYKTPLHNESSSSRARSNSMIAHRMIYGGSASQRYAQSSDFNDTP